MKPFSALYYVWENRARCILLTFMLFLGYAAYLGGIYVTNPRDNWDMPISYYDRFVYVNSTSGDAEEFARFCREAEESGRAAAIELGSYNSFNWESIMGFELGQFSLTFRSAEDFRSYCEYMGIDCDFKSLKSGSMILSERFANNVGLKIGDKIGKDYSESIYSEFTLDAVTKEEGYALYFITEENDTALNAVIIGRNGTESKELYELAYSLQERYDIYIHDGLEEEVDGWFKSFNMIYMFIIILMAAIMAVTIHAAFVGMYQRRNFEFAVYRAIGISKKRIVGKIVGELFYMDVAALVIGGGVFFLGLYLFNQLVLAPAGKYLCYFHPMALLGLALCNLAAILPLIVTRSRQMLRADICEY